MMPSESILIFAGLATAVLSSTTPPLIAIKGCTYKGQTYTTGENFQPNPCMHCYCTASGETPCAIEDCFFTPCVDSVNDPKQCCRACPNGPNCQHPDGTIIKKGDTYRPNPDTVCECPTNTFGFRGTVAICAVSMTAPPPD